MSNTEEENKQGTPPRLTRPPLRDDSGPRTQSAPPQVNDYHKNVESQGSSKEVDEVQPKNKFLNQPGLPDKQASDKPAALAQQDHHGESGNDTIMRETEKLKHPTGGDTQHENRSDNEVNEVEEQVDNQTASTDEVQNNNNTLLKTTPEYVESLHASHSKEKLNKNSKEGKGRGSISGNESKENTGKPEIETKNQDTTDYHTLSNTKRVGQIKYTLDEKRDLESISGSEGEDEHQPQLEYKPRQSKRVEGKYMYIVIVAFSIVIVFAGILFREMIENEGSLSISPPPSFDILKGEIDKLDEIFQKQHGEMWNVVQVSIEDIVYQSNPQKPAVLLFASSPEGVTTVQCLKLKISELAAKFLNTKPFKINITEFSKNDPKEAKFQLDERLKHGFKSGSRVLLIDGLHLLPAETALLLHGYADNENAPYKKAVILFSCEIPSAELLKGGDSSLDELKVKNELVNDYLRTLWEGYLGSSKAQALVSRVAWNTLFVHPEKEIPPSCRSNGNS